MFINRTKSALLLADKLSSCHCHNLGLALSGLFLPPALSALLNVIIIQAGEHITLKVMFMSQFYISCSSALQWYYNTNFYTSGPSSHGTLHFSSDPGTPGIRSMGLDVSDLKRWSRLLISGPFITNNAQLVKRVNRVLKAQKVGKSRLLLLIQSNPPNNEFYIFVKGMTKILHPKKFFRKQMLPKLCSMFRKG